MALKGFLWAVVTVLSLAVAVLIVSSLLLIAHLFEKHPQHVQAADGLNYALAAVAGYFLADPERTVAEENTPEEIDD